MTIYETRFKNRLNVVGRALDVFSCFWELEYRTKQEVFSQLVRAFPEYKTPQHRAKFGLLWNFVKYDMELLEALEKVVDRINEQ